MKALKLLFYNSPAKQPKELNHFVIIVVFATLFSVLSIIGFAQNIGISSTGVVPDNSAALDVNFSDKGLLIPRVALTGTGDIATIASPATSLLVYNTGTGGLSPAGYYYNSGTILAPNWIRLNTGSGSGWLTTGNAGTIDGTNFLGTTDNVPFNFRVNNNKAGRIASTGETFFGYLAGNSNTATNNTGIGYMALNANTTGIQNTAVGYNALLNNNIGNYNTALGWEAGKLIAGDGVNNGYFNTAVGYEALWNVKGSFNVGIGGYNGMNNWAPSDEANNNTWVGVGAGFQNDVGDDNVLIGYYAGCTNQRGGKNTMIGSEAGRLALSPSANNTCLGYHAGYGAGPFAQLYNNNLFIGYQAGDNVTTGSNNLLIGYDIDLLAAGGSNQLSIGNLIFGTGIDGTGTTISSGNIGIGTNALVTNAKLAIKNGHFQVQQTTAPTAAGTWAPTLTNATDVAGKISFTTTAAVGTVTVTFNKAYTTAPVVILTPTNGSAAGTAAADIAKVYVTSTITTFVINFGVAAVAGLHTYNYYVIETQ